MKKTEKADKAKVPDVAKKRKKAEIRLNKDEELFRYYMENAPDGVYMCDLTGTFLYGNRKSENIIGYKREELIGKNFLELNLLTEEGMNKALRWLEENIKGNPTSPEEIELIRKDGQMVPVEINTGVVQLRGEKIILAFVRETAERKQAEKALQESEQKYKNLIDNILDIIITIDLEGNITFVSKKMKEILGYEDEETIKTNFLNFISEEAHQGAMETLQKGMKGEKIRHVQLPVISKSGKKYFFDFSFTRLYQDGVVVGAQGTAVDVTERKLADELLKQSEAKYHLLADHMKDYVWLMDLNLQWTYMSPSGEKLLGYTLEELKQIPLDKLLTATSYQVAMNLLSLKMETAQTAPTELTLVEFECHCKDGRTLWIESTLSFIRDENRNPVSILGEGRDITERKRMEEKLRFEEQRFRAFVEHSPDMIVIVNLEGRIIYVNPAIENILGYTPEERIGAFGFEIVHPDDLNALADVFNTLSTETNPTVIHGELRLRHKDGSWRTLEAVGSNQVYNNVIKGLIVNYRDITKRKQAEEALRESEARFREVLENSADASYKRNLRTDSYDYLSPVFTKNYGYTMEEMMNKPLEALMDLVHPDDLAEAKRVIDESTLGAVGTVSQIKYRIRLKNGLYRWCLDQFTIMRDAEGIPIAVIGSVKDITEQKEAEDALRESERRYQELSSIDDLTQLYNSRHFYVQLEREMERSNRYGQPLTLMMLDLDKFKNYNDTYGHLEGNKVLSRLGQTIKRCLRDTDSAYRYGGEEFMIILPVTTSKDGIVTAERIQRELRQEVFSPVLDKEIYVTVSIGLAQYKPKEEMKAFVQMVDQLMYQAKKNGRNRICSELE
ncbi:MAG: PAS domain S-box protein [Bacteroidia bacterium]|nr:PAS domain S-box protein [Bacteroidia bacterium]